jgi:hypothetical protein
MAMQNYSYAFLAAKWSRSCQSWAQIWQWHNACPIQQSESNPLACPIISSDIISKVYNGSASITNELLKFGYSVGRYGADGRTCVLVVIGCPTGPEPSMPLKHLCRAHDFFLEHLSNHCQSLHCTFSQALHKIWCTLAVRSIVKYHRARYTWLQIKERKKSASLPSCVKFLYTRLSRYVSTIQSRKLWIMHLSVPM